VGNLHISLSAPPFCLSASSFYCADLWVCCQGCIVLCRLFVGDVLALCQVQAIDLVVHLLFLLLRLHLLQLLPHQALLAQPALRALSFTAPQAVQLCCHGSQNYNLGLRFLAYSVRCMQSDSFSSITLLVNYVSLYQY